MYIYIYTYVYIYIYIYPRVYPNSITHGIHSNVYDLAQLRVQLTLSKMLDLSTSQTVNADLFGYILVYPNRVYPDICQESIPMLVKTFSTKYPQISG